MFKRLRNKLIAINLSVTGAVILIVFVMIYIVTTRPVPGRPMMPEAVANDLLISLIASGLMIEIVVAVVSYFLAEEAIKPVREAYESQKIFIANASHEIKTPLAAIQANLEAADLHENRWIRNVENETEHLTKLNNELLTLARTDMMPAGKTEEVAPAEVVEKCLENHVPRLKNHDVRKKIVSREKIKINRGDFEQVINILLDNAIKYSTSKIMIEVSGHDFVIKNDGAKISAEALPHVFERFYQADKSSEGVGLGLSIAKAVAERNHWKLAAKSEKMTTFILEF